MIETASVLTSEDAVETMRSTQEALNVTSAFLMEFASYVTKQVSMTRKSTSLRVVCKKCTTFVHQVRKKWQVGRRKGGGNGGKKRDGIV